MYIKKYGIVLERLKEEDLEMVRQWRNSDHVRANMHYQGIITPDMQHTWFHTMDRTKNLYFVIVSDGKKTGLVNLKDLHRNLKTAEAGIFIGETEHLNSMTPVLATVCLMEFAFEVLGVETLRAKMSAANEKVIEFNKRIGYTRAEYQSDNQFHYYHTNKEAFNKAITGIRETLQKLDSGVFEIDITTSEMKELLLNPSHLSLRDLKLKITEAW